MTEKTEEQKPIPELTFDVNWVWTEAISRADNWAQILNEGILTEKDTSDHNVAEVQISQTASFLLLACFLNTEILDDPHLDNLLKTAKATAKFVRENLPDAVKVN